MPGLSNSDANSQAFPPADINNAGLTKRELLAAMAMQGYCATGESSTSHDQRASWSIAAADALLKALAK